MIQTLKIGFTIAEKLVKIIQVSAAALIIIGPLIGVFLHLLVIFAPFPRKPNVA